jgi:hypothetical protein
MLFLLIACIAILLGFLARFPREASTRPMEPFTVETYFNTGWENDLAGGFVWVLNDKNTIVITNNEDVKKSGHLDIQILGAPCGGSHEVSISGKSFSSQRVTVNANQSSVVKLQLMLNPFARVPVNVDVLGEGCVPSATDGRLIKVQIRQPIFVPREPVVVETYFDAVWENDLAGGFVWVLNDKNKIVIVNNEDVKKSGHLDIQILGAPCGGSYEVSISGKSFSSQRVTVNANQTSVVKLQLKLDAYARVPVNVDVLGEGCVPSATDGRLIKVQIRQPIFVPS